MSFEWFPDWRGCVAAIIASGESATKDAVAVLNGRVKVIAVNNSFGLAPFTDVLYAADPKWWGLYRPAFAGLKVTSDQDAAQRLGLESVRVRDKFSPKAHEIVLDPRGTLGHGGNGGFQAINLALQFGARRLILVGFDMCGEHWHGRHPAPLMNPQEKTLLKWRDRLDAQASLLRDIGADVVNASDVSTLKAYPKMSVESALDRWAA